VFDHPSLLHLMEERLLHQILVPQATVDSYFSPILNTASGCLAGGYIEGYDS
jgi:hypothetical protein